MLIPLRHLRRREHMASWVHRKLSRQTTSCAREVDAELRSRHPAAFVEREDAARAIERIVILLVEANATGAATKRKSRPTRCIKNDKRPGWIVEYRLAAPGIEEAGDALEGVDLSHCFAQSSRHDCLSGWLSPGKRLSVHGYDAPTDMPRLICGGSRKDEVGVGATVFATTWAHSTIGADETDKLSL